VDSNRIRPAHLVDGRIAGVHHCLGWSWWIHLWKNKSEIITIDIIQSEAKNFENTHFMQSRFFLPSVV
jgi:hypothetical protein